MKHALFAVSVLVSFLVISCEVIEKAVPVPPDKEAFIGTWKSKSGFMMEIMNDGTVNLSHSLKPEDPDYIRLCITVGPPVINGILVKFEGDSVLNVLEPMVYGRRYSIDRFPYQEDGQWKMMLNGVLLVR